MNSAGVLPSEAQGLAALSEIFPEKWLFYAAFTYSPPRESPMDIDAMVVMDDRVLILEQKCWDGEITCNGDVWFNNGQIRGRSPADSVANKARILGQALRDSIPGFRFFVDSGVVLTGSATNKNLPKDQADRTWSLEDVRRIVDPKTRLSILPSQAMRLKPAFSFESELDKLTRKSRRFKPKEIVFDGYKVIQENLFVHPKRVWSEHRAVLGVDRRHSALLRLWAFDRLPPGLNTQPTRRAIAQRELNAVGYLRQVNSKIVSAGQVLEFIGDIGSEVLTQHFDLRRLDRGWFQLSNYLERYKDEVSAEDRITIAQTLLNVVSELHAKQVAHRDLGPKNIWIGAPSQLAVSGFSVAALPGEESVSDWLSDLEAYSSTSIGTSKFEGSSWQRDVFCLAVLCEAILSFDESFSGREIIQTWLKRSKDVSASNAFANAVEMSNDFGRIVAEDLDTQPNHSLLDRFETELNPFFEWTPVSRLSKGKKEVYTAVDPELGLVVVKLWTQLFRGRNAQTDTALLRLLDGTSRLATLASKRLPAFGKFGISQVGAFVTYRHIDGISLDKHKDELDAIAAVRLAADVVGAVDDLHRSGLTHGDLNHSNVLITAEDEVLSAVVVDLFDVGDFGDGIVRSPKWMPPNWERLSDEQIDRYAATQIAKQLLERVPGDRLVGCKKRLDEELARPVIEQLDSIRDLLIEAESELTRPPIPIVRLALLETAVSDFKSDGGAYYVRAERLGPTVVKYVVYGATHRLTILFPQGKDAVATTSAYDFETLRRESLACKRIEARIELSESRHVDVSEFLPLVADLPIANVDVTSEPDDPSIKQQPLEEVEDEVEFEVESDLSDSERPFDLQRYWQRSVELEENLVPEVVLTSDAISAGNRWLAKYDVQRGDFDFDPEDSVDVHVPGRSRRIGRLDTLETDGNQLVVRDLTWSLREGDVVQLRERQASTSFDRRKRAVDRISSGRSSIQDLISYFDRHSSRDAVQYLERPTDAELAPYRLNAGQIKAFCDIAQFGPVGLLQGPPGTGKTRFIAAFVHWLTQTNKVERVLIASQSHEAVNNVIEATVKLFRSVGKRPNLLRIGSKNITTLARPFHITAVREKYAASFINAFRTRVSALASAGGIDRKFAEQVVDLDRELGELLRRLAFINETNAVENQSENRRALPTNSISRAIESRLKKEGMENPDLSNPMQVLSNAIERLRLKFPDISDADASNMQRLLMLSQEWVDALGSTSRNFEEFLAKTKTIVTGTCVGLGQTRIRIDRNEYDWVIVDEAARCTPGELAVPLQLGRRVLLVGDHFQLKPMIEDEVIRELGREFPELGEDALKTSEFERSFRSDYGLARGQVLNEQYRMAEPICRLVSQVFYEPDGVRLETSDDRESQEVFGRLEPEKPLSSCITWIDTSNEPRHLEQRGRRNRWTYFNPAEIEAILKLLQRIAETPELFEYVTRADDEHPIGIICMYMEQRLELDRRLAQSDLPAEFKDKIRVDTVDSYQGKENTIVIVTLVRSNKARKSGHVRIPNRCNVAMSRAKERLVVVGDTRMWSEVAKDAPMRRVLETISDLERPSGAIIEARSI